MAFIIKKSSHRYEVITAIASKPIFSFGDFIRTREKHGMKTDRFEHCFGCGHAFTDDESVYFGTVKPKGNIFFCKDCAEKYCTENTETEDAR